MDTGNGYSLSDLAAATNGGCNNWGNDWMGMFFIFALLCGFGNGGFGFGNNGFANAIGYENLATSAEVQRGLDNQNSMANQREILAAVSNNALQEMQNSNQNTQYITGQLADKYNEIQRDIAGVAMMQQQTMAGQQSCCCNIQMVRQYQVPLRPHREPPPNRWPSPSQLQSATAGATATRRSRTPSTPLEPSSTSRLT